METTTLYDFIMILCEDFAAVMPDQTFAIFVSTVASGVILAFVSGVISAVWGACGALAALRRSKRG